eukprot:c21122_g1_i1 orf=1-444(-)
MWQNVLLHQQTATGCRPLAECRPPSPSPLAACSPGLPSALHCLLLFPRQLLSWPPSAQHPPFLLACRPSAPMALTELTTHRETFAHAFITERRGDRGGRWYQGHIVGEWNSCRSYPLCRTLHPKWISSETRRERSSGNRPWLPIPSLP